MENSKILLVDDDQDIRDILRVFLEGLGYIIEEAENGIAALKILRNDEIDLVITDIQMPEMSGISLLEKIKEYNQDIPVIVITGFPTIDVAVGAMKRGASDFITKPFKMAQIEMVVKRVIINRDLLRENKKLKEEVRQKRTIESLNKKLNSKIEELSKLYYISESIPFTKDEEILYESIIKTASEVTGAKKVFLMFKQKDSDELVLKKYIGVENEIKNIRVKIGEGIVGEVAQLGNSFLVKSGEKKKLKPAPFEELYISNSFISLPIFIQKDLAAVLILSHKADGSDFTEDDLSLINVLCGRASLSLENLFLFKTIYEHINETLKSLINSIEARDKYTKRHSERVTALALKIASEMGLSSEEKNTLVFAGYLHDIGKIGVRDSILLKPNNLTGEEFREIMVHPVIGETIVKPLTLLPKVPTIIRHHHERWDGSGYPDGLKGKEIPLESRILAVADTFDAMTSIRPYRYQKTVNEAIREIIAKKNIYFDPEVVDAFYKLTQEMEPAKFLSSHLEDISFFKFPITAKKL